MSSSSLKRWFMPLWQAIVELIFYAPIWLTIGIYSLSDSMLLLWVVLLIVTYWLPYQLLYNKSEVRNAYRISAVLLLGGAPLLILAALTSQDLPLNAWIGCLLVGFAFVTNSFRSLQLGWINSFSSTIMLIFLFLAVVLQVLKVTALHELASYNTLFYSLGILAVLLFLYIHNERMVTDQQMIDASSATIKRSVIMNRIYITIISLLVVGIMLFRDLQRLVERYVGEWITALLAWLLRERAVEEPPPQEQPSGEMPQLGDLGPQGEPSKFWAILELIVKWLAIAALIALAVVVVYYAVRKLMPLMKQMLAHLLRLKGLQGSTATGYTDEIEELVPEKLKEKKQKKVKPAAKLKGWKGLSAAEKVRALYRSTVDLGRQKGKPIAPYYTAKETIALLKEEGENANNHAYERLLERYNDTRYGDIEPNEQEIDRLKEQLEQTQKKGRS